MLERDLPQMKIIDQQLLDELSLKARQSARLRKNHNFHPADDFSCHRLLNAIEPGTYIPPHRHLDNDKDETMVMVRGRMAIIAFDNQGNITLKHLLNPKGAAVAVDIPRGVFHTVISLESGTVFFEAKAGPYRPFTEQELAPWGPKEGTPEAAAYVARLEGEF